MVKILKKIFKFLMSRLFIISILILLQLFMIVYAFYYLQSSGIVFLITFEVLSILVAFAIINRDFNPAYKISWILAVLLIPFAGTCFYILFGRVRISKKNLKHLYGIINREMEEIDEDKELLATIDDLEFLKMSNYIKNTTGKRIFAETKTTILTPGEKWFQVMVEKLKTAKKFIFLEYFIIRPGKMWSTILEVLEEKVKEGVDVRLMYDDFGTINKLPYNFKKKMLQKGIKVINFNPYRPKLSMFMNYRDHRKIAVIDGNIGFTGGANLADEYINLDTKFGYWKDSAIMIEGQAVWNLTLLFLQTWEFSSKDVEEYEQFKPTLKMPSDGFIHVFGDSPISNHLTTENTYISIINNAKKYVYITTPYLIIDNEFLTALKMAAISGVDVRIAVPHIPDKKIIFYVTQSYYRELIMAGVKIYEYLPGFLHSKIIISDDKIGMIGTANLDYRSLYLHFESSCVIYKTESVLTLAEDVKNIISLSKNITYEDTKKRPFFKKLIAFFLRALSPLM